MAYTSDQKKDIAADAGLEALESSAKWAAMGTAIAPGLGTAIGATLGLVVGGTKGLIAGKAAVEEEEAEKEAMDAREDAAKVARGAAPSDSKVLEASMPVQGGGASSSDYFSWRQNTQGY